MHLRVPITELNLQNVKASAAFRIKVKKNSMRIELLLQRKEKQNKLLFVYPAGKTYKYKTYVLSCNSSCS